MSDEGRPPASSRRVLDLLGGGAVGVGLVLVFLPALTMVWNVEWFEKHRSVGLPVLAILGIMILLGTLSLVAMLFSSLKLTDASQPLALPPGSMRAAMALSLIVLFAIISITLYQSIVNGGEPYRVDGLRLAERNALVAASPSRVMQTSEEVCAVAPVPPSAPSSAPAVEGAAPVPCAEADRRFAVVLRAAAPEEAVDLAKQLLILVGTLMTSVTSYYFAARTGAVSRKADTPEPATPTGAGIAPPEGGSRAASGAAAATQEPVLATLQHKHAAHDPDDADGCDVEIVDSTPDEHLPPAEGGVAPTAKVS